MNSSANVMPAHSSVYKKSPNLQSVLEILWSLAYSNWILKWALLMCCVEVFDQGEKWACDCFLQNHREHSTVSIGSFLPLGLHYNISLLPKDLSLVLGFSLCALGSVTLDGWLRTYIPYHRSLWFRLTWILTLTDAKTPWFSLSNAAESFLWTMFDLVQKPNYLPRFANVRKAYLPGACLPCPLSALSEFPFVILHGSHHKDSKNLES